MTRPPAGAVRGLAAACHPLPTLAVTVTMAVLVAAAGNAWQTVLVATLAVLTGQLSIGWSNDVLDSPRDALAGRTDKPVATGVLSRSTTASAAAVAAAATVPMSLALGWRAGLVHLVSVCCGWLYNVVLKSTPLSALPYAVAFAGLPAIATLALPSHPWPPVWAPVAGGLVGVAAHFGNALPDLDADRRTGVIGLPHRFGRLGSVATVATCGLGATALVLSQSVSERPVLDAAFAVAAVGSSCVAVVAVRRSPHSEAAFHATMVLAGIDVALIALSHGLV